MALPGVHLTRIGKGNFLLEPLQSLDIAARADLVRAIVAELQAGQAVRLYYDLSGLPVIDETYLGWLNELALTCRVANIEMICINMQPTAAFALSLTLAAKPAFATALGIPD